MDEAQTERQPTLLAVANALTRLHKEQFGRGPTAAWAHFAGPDTLVCVLEGALLPAEVKLTELGQQDQVRHSRSSYQAATAAEFIDTIEGIIDRRVVAFGSAVDPDSGVVFENFRLAQDSGPRAVD